ncbi:ABC transporter substrate-binding protein [Massilia sp. 9096]|uniref:ABC transporter substrate-binding protein n=1 Tax=Massilia sp. 9096 TaxID=1500894 RepID=UPI000560D8F9|nr:ABC transporter substrate-binding protein [Massilia sp. 9096]
MVSRHFTKMFLGASLALAAGLALAENGVSDKSIVIGQSAALSGPASALGTAMRDGALAYFDAVNADGGVHGRQIVLKTVDDGYDPARAGPNTGQLVDKDKVFALFGYVGTPTSNAAMAWVDKGDVPFFAPMTGAQTFREPVNRNVFNIRDGYADETEKIVEHLDAIGVKQIAVLYQDDAYGKAGLEGVTQALKKRKQDVFVTATVERNSVDVAAAVAKMKAAKPHAVIMISAYKSSAAFIRAMRKASDSVPFFWNVSFVGSQALMDELGPDASGVMISQVMPSPWDEKIAVVKEYRKLYLAKPGREPDYASLEGFIAAKVFVEGLRHVKGDVTRKGFTHALETMGATNLGGYTVQFSPSNHNGSNYVDLSIITRKGKIMY